MSKPYVRPIPWAWWNQNNAYRLFMLRELSSVFVALYAVEMIYLLKKISGASVGDLDRVQRLQVFFESLSSPLWVAFHVIALAFALLHTITWFNLTPKVMVVRLGEGKLPDVLIAGHLYVVWGIVSIIVWSIVL